jgi:hypothetical protein
MLLLSSPNPTHAIDCPATSVGPPHADTPLPTTLPYAGAQLPYALRPPPSMAFDSCCLRSPPQ